VLFCIGCRILSKLDHPPPQYQIKYQIDFQDGGHQPYCICFRVMADHQRSAFRLNSILKSLVRQINSSGDIAMYRFWCFGLKLPIHAPFGVVFGAYFFI